MPRLRSNYGIIGTPQTLVVGSIRGGMFSGTDQYNLIRSNVWPYGGTTDVNLRYTPFLLSARNYDPTNLYFFKDASTNNFALTIVGDTKGTPFSPYNTSWSNYFNGASALVFTSGSQFNIGTGAYTLEGWVNFVTAPNNTYLFGCLAANGLCFYYSGTSTLTVYQYGVGAKVSATFTPTLGIWYHFAAARSNNGTSVIWINGVSYARSNDTTNYSLAAFSVGGIAGGFVTGTISNVRLTFNDEYGVSNTNIIVPTQNLTTGNFCSILTCQSNRFIDNSLNNAVVTLTSAPTVVGFGPFTETDITTGSTYFDASGDYLSVAGSSAFAFGTGDFTVEVWIYTNNISTATFDRICATSDFSGSGFDWTLNTASSAFFLASTSYSIGPLPNNVWHHLVFTRSGTVIRGFINGKMANYTTGSSQNISSTATLNIGAGYSGTQFNGYMNGLRLIKGSIPVEYQTSSITVGTQVFTPPTTSLTAITDTQLLTLQTRQNMNNNVFFDSSPAKSLITRIGNSTQGTFTPFSQTGWSNYFSGSGSYVSATGTLITTTTSTFTVECWIYPTVAAVSGSSIPSIVGDMQPASTNNYWSFGTLASGAVALYWFDGAAKSAATTGTVSLNQWTHITVSVNANAIAMYINGSPQTLTGTTTLTNRSGTNGTFALAQFSNAASLYTGYISNLRITTTALYTGSFAPPTSPLTAITSTVLLTSQSNRFLDNSTNAYTIVQTASASVQAFSPFSAPTIYTPSIIGGSAYFDGTADYITTAYTANWSTAGSYTFECWIYPTVLTGSSATWIATVGTGGTGYTIFYVYQASAASGPYSIAVGINGTNEIKSGNNVVLPGAWYHVAYTYDGTTTKIYVNGTQVVSAATAVYANNSGTFNIGGGSAGTYFSGYISNVKLVRGSVLYTSTFTVPTAPFTVTSTNTVLLLNFTNANLIDYTSANILETVADAKLSTAVTKFNSASIYFDGTGDYLLLSSTAANQLALGTGNFTIEMWFYVNTTAAAQILIDFRPTGTDGVYPMIYVASGGGSVRFNVSSADQITGTTTISISTWYHFALSRSSGSTKMFVNGTQVGSTYTDANNYLVGTSRPIIGAGGNSLGATPLNGYIDELRITKAARYTANFAAPTSALPLVGFTPVTTVIPLEWIVVAGGGGGGGDIGGGGGAGGMRNGINYTVLTGGSTYTVTVGAGGAGSGVGNGNPGTIGSSSILASITSTGGGRGAAISSTTGGTGGSGGGGSGGTAGGSATAITQVSGEVSTVQGYNGGSGGSNTMGAGGGASAVGNGGSYSSAGGAGRANPITGSTAGVNSGGTYYLAGGGGAGGRIDGSPADGGAGGLGGGGKGQGGSGYTTSAPGTDNTGGGGGGGGFGNGATCAGRSGGSGIVVLAYPDSYPDIVTIGAGLTYTSLLTGGKKIYTFTAGTGTINW